MRHSEAKPGRIFVIRLEDGDRLPDSIESFAEKHDVHRAACILVGGTGRWHACRRSERRRCLSADTDAA